MSDLANRKKSHVEICLQEDVTGFTPTGFEKVRLVHNALPEVNLEDIDTTTEFLGKKLKLPFFISSMTGGYEKGKEIIQNLARAAQEKGIALGVGSQRIALEDPNNEEMFQVRDVAPDILLFANLGAVQLNYGYGVEEYQRAVEMIGADGLFLHLNPVQEAIQPEGNPNYRALLPKIETLVKALKVPVVVKEVGMGISGEVAQRLRKAGVRYIDVAGQGGTSWSFIEGIRAKNDLGKVFAGWGIPTVEALRQCRRVEGLTLLASGGIRNGIEVAKALALGAKLVGLALPFLEAATQSATKVTEVMNRIETELRIAMFGIGAKDLTALNSSVIDKIAI